MSFHPDKCWALHINLHGHPLKSTSKTNYLGVTLSNDLCWYSHINSTTNMASKTVTFLRSNIKVVSMTTKEQAYKTLIKLMLEFTSPVWDPYTVKNINKLEVVQNRGLRSTTLQ